MLAHTAAMRQGRSAHLRAPGTGRWIAVAFVVVAGLSCCAAALAFNPVREAQNLSKGKERQAVYLTAGYLALLAKIGSQNAARAARVEASDPSRDFKSNTCATETGFCAGDVRLYSWGPKGYGLVAPVLFTARDGATIAGHVWATRAGPPQRPGVVITSGSLGADEQMYWYAAQALAKDGYVVLTWDPQGQGQSDAHGQSPDQSEGYPAQSDGRPFFDGTEDALDFFLSTKAHHYKPVSSCNTGTSHAAKQNARVKAGLDAAYNPFWYLLNDKEIGLAGHSYGATGVSYIGQWDKRVKAIVAWDNLRAPTATQDGVNAGIKSGGRLAAGELGCPADRADRRPAPITKPALGFSSDYFLVSTPYRSDPTGDFKAAESRAYTRAGADTGEIIIRGGTHYEFGFLPSSIFPATLRGIDETTWYTTAWFDKYLKHEPGADDRLLTNRWRDDAAEAAVDPTHDGNMFSFYYHSRLDFDLADGHRFDCEDLRAGCPGMTSRDGYRGSYSYYRIDTSHDGPGCDTAGTPARAVIRLDLRRGFWAVAVRVVAGTGGARVSYNFTCVHPLVVIGWRHRPAHHDTVTVHLGERSVRRTVSVTERRTFGPSG